MLVVLPVCAKDADAALRNLSWARELDGRAPFACLVSCESNFTRRGEIEAAARAYFGSVETFAYAPYPRHFNQRWPRPQNWAWRKVALLLAKAPRGPWLWWEQDAVPLRANWLERLRDAYETCGKPFMGARGTAMHVNVTAHLNGVAVYPPNWTAWAPQSMLVSEALPFDVCGGWRVAGQAHFTPLIQHLWSFENDPGGPPCHFETRDDLRHVSKEAVLFHRCKDGSLLEWLREVPLGAPRIRSFVAKRRMRRKGDGTLRTSLNVTPAELTVVITNFRRADFLWKAFESCQAAGICNIVVTSSGATEEVEAVHKRIMRAHPRTRIVSEREDSGSNQNWLRGVASASTEWVQILHDDDVLKPNYLKVLAALNKSDFACWDAATHGMGGGICRIFTGMPYGQHATSEMMPFLMGGKLTPSPVAGCFRKSHLQEVLSVCQDMGSEFYYRDKLLVGNDLLIWLVAARQDWQFSYLPENLTSFGCHAGSATVNSIQSRDGRLFEIYALTKQLFNSRSFEQKLAANRDRLSLMTVTLVGVDTWHPLRTLRAMKQAMEQVQFGEAVLVTTPRHKPLLKGVRVLDLIESDARLERERFLITRIGEAFGTTHCLHLEADAGIRNLSAWDDRWMGYDYIGAPWNYPAVFHDKYPVTLERCVGNLGFSLISKRLAGTLATMPPPSDEEARVSDVYLSIGLRPELEKQGIRFAPEAVAARFSCEGRTYAGQFGWHGAITAKMNGWTA